MLKCSARLIPAIALLAITAPNAAAQSAASSVPKTVPVTDKVTTPMDDLNMGKAEIPPALLEAVANPYSLEGLSRCNQLVTAVDGLNTALGDDIDLPQEGGMRLAASELVDFAASTFIPFRGLIRQVSGANARKRDLQEAVLAGFARRSFLKGVGAARNCAYPASPATAQVITNKAAALQAGLESLCGPPPAGTKRTRREEWLNSRKCADYKAGCPGSRSCNSTSCSARNQMTRQVGIEFCTVLR